jgi:hypothetical protein
MAPDDFRFGSTNGSGDDACRPTQSARLGRRIGNLAALGRVPLASGHSAAITAVTPTPGHGPGLPLCSATGSAPVLKVGRRSRPAGVLSHCEDPTVRAGAVPRRPKRYDVLAGIVLAGRPLCASNARPRAHRPRGVAAGSEATERPPLVTSELVSESGFKTFTKPKNPCCTTGHTCAAAGARRAGRSYAVRATDRLAPSLGWR